MNRFSIALLIFLLPIIVLESQAQRVLEDFHPTINRTPTLTALDIQPDGKILVGGRDLVDTNGTLVNQFARVHPDGSLDKSFKPGAFNSDNILDIVVMEDGQILLLLQEEEPQLVMADGSLVTAFNFDNTLYTRGVVENGSQLLFFGNDPIQRSFVVRQMKKDGTRDGQFREGIANQEITNVLTLNDNNLLVGGRFTEFNGKKKHSLVKLDQRGTLDKSFDVGTGSTGITNMAEDGDGKLLIGGAFAYFNGIVASGGLIRLNSDGSIDNSFAMDQIGDLVYETSQIIPLPDGKILVGGNSSAVDNAYTIFRLHSNGVWDDAFSPIIINGGIGLIPMNLQLGSDNRLYLTGNFEEVLGQQSLGFAVFNLDGELMDVHPGFGRIPAINDALMYDNGQMLVVGEFSKVNNGKVETMARIEKDGSLDTSFHLDSDLSVYLAKSIAFQSDEKILCSGVFTAFNKEESLVRLNTNGTLDKTFSGPDNMNGVNSVIVTETDEIFVSDYKQILLLEKSGSVQPSFTTENQFPDDFSITKISLDTDGSLFVLGYKSQGGSLTRGIVYKVDATGKLIGDFANLDLSQVPVDIVRISEDRTIYGGSFVTEFHPETSKNPLYIVDNSGNIIDQSSTSILGSNLRHQLYSQFIPLSNNDVLVFGQFSEINEFQSEGIAKINLNGQIDPRVDFDLNGTAIKSFLSKTQDTVTVFGGFSTINSITRIGVAKIKLINQQPVITGTVSDFRTEENTPLEILLTDLVVTDPDSNFPEDFNMNIIGGGEHYSIVDNMVVLDAGFNGEIMIPVTVNDGKDESEPYEIVVAVAPVNEAPQITGTSTDLFTLEDTPLHIELTDFTVSDPDSTFPDDFTLSLYIGDNYTIDGNTIIPDLNFNGLITVPLSINDGIDESTTFALEINVSPVNDPPLITGVQIPLTTQQGTPITISVNDLIIEDPDNTFPNDFFIEVSQGLNYSINDSQVTPAEDFVGDLTVPVSVSDGADLSKLFDLNIEVSVVSNIASDLPYKISVYPNPVSSVLSVVTEFDLAEDLSVELVEISGKYVEHARFTQERSGDVTKINLEQVNPGIYFLQMVLGNKVVFQQKIIIQ